jgi:hypothetical protein
VEVGREEIKVWEI